MLRKKLFINGMLALTLIGQHATTWAENINKVERPPQYVLLAFDGSYDIDMWEKTRSFSKEEKKKWESIRGGDDVVKFTYFINTVFLLNPPRDSNKHAIMSEAQKLYQAPGGHKGSNIGWGDSPQDISDRVDEMNQAYLEGHEIGSHTVGHFDGTKFSLADWQSEFSQFNSILDNVFSINKIKNRDLPFKEHIIGFRAPVLGVNAALYQTLDQYGFKYDTSKMSANETTWPKKNEHNTWIFPLAALPDQGARYGVPSMDYNFCFRDSAKYLSTFDLVPGEPNEVAQQKISKKHQVLTMQVWDQDENKIVKNKAADCLNVLPEDAKQEVKAHMKKLYDAYFAKNYYGNRAPIHIGHHFSKWMSGAYREAFFEFAAKVCHMDEVKCVTYSELTDFMNSKTPEEIAAYQKGNFEKIAQPHQKSLSIERIWDLGVNVSVEQDALKFAFDGQDAGRAGLSKVVSVNGVAKEIENTLALSEVRNLVKGGETTLVRLSVKNQFGKEVLGATYKIDKVGTDQEHVNLENLEQTMADDHCEADSN
ncbi:MAG: polysaccharide deacetylase family protein [Pseudobdellovibrionaceae bacterium]